MELLKTIIEDIINENEENSKVSFRTYLNEKMSKLIEDNKKIENPSNTEVE
jgi:hypothetical protein